MSFADVLGQEAAVGLLTRSLRRGRVAHGYIFSGTEGIGKRRVAFELARALLCEARGEGGDAACGTCRSCQRLERGTHPGWRVVTLPEDKRDIPVATIREQVLDPLGLRELDGGWRVFAVDPAEAMNAEAANCLLKTLEEPSPRVVLVLVTARFDHLLPTLRSRCQVVRFRPLPPDLGRRVLAAAAPTAAPADRDEALRTAGGSPGLALRVLAAGALDAWRRWGERVLAAGPADALELAAELSDWLKQGTATLEERRARARPFLELLALRLRDRFLAAEGLAPGSPADVRFPGEKALDLIERVFEAQDDLDRNLKVDFVFDKLILACADAAGSMAQGPWRG